jgi:hypothetical protein
MFNRATLVPAPTLFDKVFGSWHDGSKGSLKVQQQRWRERRRQSA